MKKVILMAVLLTGCATQSGVIPEGKDSYLLIMSGGYQNLISMIFRLMSFRDAWMRVGKASKTTGESKIEY